MILVIIRKAQRSIQEDERPGGQSLFVFKSSTVLDMLLEHFSVNVIIELLGARYSRAITLLSLSL